MTTAFIGRDDLMSKKTDRALNSNPELRKLLENVSGSYSDFVLGVMLTCENNSDYQNKMISFIKSHPDANTDDVGELENKLYFGY